MEREFKKSGIKAEAADTLCGEIPHMTVDQLASRLCIQSRELRCPACGRIHLTDEDVREAEERRFSDTERFRQIKIEAEGGE
ncbi:MAG: hypothetical protein AAGU11_18560 [Syntrophobacteraceae bacterium]